MIAKTNHLVATVGAGGHCFLVPVVLALPQNPDMPGTFMRIQSWPKKQLIARNFTRTIYEADETQWFDGCSPVILVPKQMPAPRHASSPAPKHTALGGGSKAPKGLNLGTVNWELLANLFKSGFDWQVLMKLEMASFCSF